MSIHTTRINTPLIEPIDVKPGPESFLLYDHFITFDIIGFRGLEVTTTYTTGYQDLLGILFLLRLFAVVDVLLQRQADLVSGKI